MRGRKFAPEGTVALNQYGAESALGLGEWGGGGCIDRSGEEG